jgi:hypothetical protein
VSARLALNTLCKWRTLFAGWQLGTRPKGDPESDAVRDHREVTILLRAEVTALTDVLLRKGLMTAEEVDAAMEREAIQLSKDYARRFPGVTASPLGLQMDTERIRREGWMKGWRP